MTITKLGHAAAFVLLTAALPSGSAQAKAATWEDFERCLGLGGVFSPTVGGYKCCHNNACVVCNYDMSACAMYSTNAPTRLDIGEGDATDGDAGGNRFSAGTFQTQTVQPD